MEKTEYRPHGEFPLTERLARQYADRLCGGDHGKAFSRDDIKMAYLMGGAAAMTRTREAILHACGRKTLSGQDTSMLLAVIDHIENLPIITDCMV